MKSKDTAKKTKPSHPAVETIVIPPDSSPELIGEFTKAEKAALTADFPTNQGLVIAKVTKDQGTATFHSVALPVLDLTFPLKPPGFSPSINLKRLWTFSEPPTDDIKVVWQAYKPNSINSRTAPDTRAVFLPDGALWLDIINVTNGVSFGISSLNIAVAMTSDRPFSFNIEFLHKRATYTVHAVKVGSFAYVAQKSWVIRTGSEDITLKWIIGASSETLVDPLVTLSKFEISRVTMGF